MRVSEKFRGSYFKASDIDKPIDLVIKSIIEETIGSGREAQDVTVLYFRGEDQGLILNKTNAYYLAQAIDDETDNWKGETITLYSTPVSYQGKSVDGLRVRYDPPTRDSKSHRDNDVGDRREPRGHARDDDDDRRSRSKSRRDDDDDDGRAKKIPDSHLDDEIPF